MRRHETLRTRLPVRHGQPVQVIGGEIDLEVPVLDLRDMPASMREAEVQRLGAKEAQHVFDLARGPLFRATLVRVADDDHRLQLNMHHIISDGWSMGVLMRELTVLYDAFASGRKSPLAELPVQYADYSLWQRGWLQGGCWSSSWPTGNSSWPEPATAWPCPPTGLDQRCKASEVADRASSAAGCGLSSSGSASGKA